MFMFWGRRKKLQDPTSFRTFYQLHDSIDFFLHFVLRKFDLCFDLWRGMLGGEFCKLSNLTFQPIQVNLGLLWCWDFGIAWHVRRRCGCFSYNSVQKISKNMVVMKKHVCKRRELFLNTVSCILLLSAWLWNAGIWRTVLGGAVGAEVLVVLRGAGPNFTANCSCFRALKGFNFVFSHKNLKKIYGIFFYLFYVKFKQFLLIFWSGWSWRRFSSCPRSLHR